MEVNWWVAIPIVLAMGTLGGVLGWFFGFIGVLVGFPLSLLLGFLTAPLIFKDN